MALSDSRPQRVCMLCAMYFAQGVPWGFMTIALVSYLLQRGITDMQAGTLTAVVLLPWTFKIVWAPVIDTLTIRSMGRRRPWIIGAELMMALSLLGLLAMGDLTESLGTLWWMFFIHNCFASLQDVSTDALAVDILPHAEQGRTNGMMWGSKLIGKGLGASVMASVIAMFGLQAAVLIQFLILIIVMMLPLFILERPGEKRFPWSKGQAQGVADGGSDVRSLAVVLGDLKQGFGTISTSVYVLFGLMHVVGWGIVEVATKALYTKQLGWDYTDVSNVSGLAVFPELGAALIGGYMADRFGRRLVMTIGFGGYGLMALLVGCFPSLWQQNWFTAGYLLLNPGILAMGAVGFLSMGMRLSWTQSAATMFTIYMTLSNVGHVLGNTVVGMLRDPEWLDLSYQATFGIAALTMFVPLLLLPLVRPEQIDRLREKERDARNGIA